MIQHTQQCFDYCVFDRKSYKKNIDTSNENSHIYLNTNNDKYQYYLTPTYIPQQTLESKFSVIISTVLILAKVNRKEGIEKLHVGIRRN